MQASALHLAGMGLSPADIDKEIDGAKKVQCLNLSSADLLIIPPAVLNLTHLTAIDLSNNRISKVEGLERLPFLVSLNLSVNILVSLPVTLCWTRLVSLNLAHNNLQILPQSIGELTALEELDLQKNNIGSLPSSFTRLSQLVRLNLSSNVLFALPDGFSLPKLKKLELNSNDLHSISLGKMPELREIYAFNNPLTNIRVELGHRDLIKYVNFS